MRDDVYYMPLNVTRGGLTDEQRRIRAECERARRKRKRPTPRRK